MQKYNSSKIRSVIEALACVYGINLSRWHVTYGTAMVMHGLATSSPDIDIGLNDEDWKTFSEYHTVITDELGPIIELPGKVEVRPLTTVHHPFMFVRKHGFMVADLVSLHAAYCLMIDTPLPGRDKREQDQDRVNILVTELNRLRMRGDVELRRDADMLAECAMDLIIQNNLSGVFAKVSEKHSEHEYYGEIKDAARDTWAYMVNHKDPVIEIEHEKMGHRYRVRVDKI